MTRRTVFAILGVLFIVGLFGTIFVTGGDGNLNRDSTQTVIVSGPNGASIPENSTVVINADTRDHRGFPPIGFFLVLILGFILVKVAVFGRSGGAPWRHQNRQRWFDEMHRISHQQDRSVTAPPATESTPAE